jgi:hypothetical protein
MKDIGIDYLTQMIKGKRVALIGPAEYVCKEFNSEHGKYIDNFDIVIKMNGMIHLPNKELEKYYGEKMDILISSFWFDPENKQQYDLLVKYYEDKYYNSERYINPDYYKNINHDLLLFENMPRKLFQKIYNKNKEIFDNNKNLKYHCITNKFSNQTRNFLNNLYNLNTGTTTGLLSIANILLCNPKELYISGLTFYKDTKHKAYYSNYWDRKKEGADDNNYNNNMIFNNNIISNSVKLMTGHNIKGEQEIFKKLIKNKLIKVDSYLNDLYN